MPFPVAEQFIVETERKLGVSFPEAFRSRMCRNNGGELSTDEDTWQLYPFFDTSDRKRLSRTSNDIVRETASARQWRGFPPDAIAIGSNSYGDYLVFLPSPGSTTLQPQPFAWLHETGELQQTDIPFEDADSSSTGNA
jgi:hypothetical protein